MVTLSDPSKVVKLNAASVARAVRSVVEYADGTNSAQKAVNRALDAVDNADRELLMIAFREMFNYGRTTAMRAAYHEREERRAFKLRQAQ